MNGGSAPRLERLSGPSRGDWVRVSPSYSGFERVEAFFGAHAFDAHRHDAYAIGYTMGGVQSFRYRGVEQASAAGQFYVLHPDEPHDGHAGTDGGFQFRTLYIEPRLIQEALAEQTGSSGRGATLPFLPSVVSSDQRLAAAIIPALEGIGAPLDELQRDEIIDNLAKTLADIDPSMVRNSLNTAHGRAVCDARDYLDANAQMSVSSAELEGITGVSRYALVRHFKACLGTSPHRYLIMRRLQRARSLILQGEPLADAAMASGFADQSHLNRQFKKAYGVTPGRWATIAKTATA